MLSPLRKVVFVIANEVRQSQHTDYQYHEIASHLAMTCFFTFRSGFNV